MRAGDVVQHARKRGLDTASQAPKIAKVAQHLAVLDRLHAIGGINGPVW